MMWLDAMTILLFWITLLVLRLITWIAGNLSIKVLDIHWRHHARKRSYYLTYRLMLIWGVVLLFQFDLPWYLSFLFPWVIAFVSGMLYFRTKGWKYVVEPIIFGLFLLMFLIVLASGLFVSHALFFTPVTVAGESMSPSYIQWDVAIVMQQPVYERGDIIFYTYDDGEYLKRIVWVPTPQEIINLTSGTLEICTLDPRKCEVMDESYLPAGTKTPYYCDTPAFVVDTWYFVIGDNRSASTDSRSYLDGDCNKQDPSYLVWPSSILWAARYKIPKQYAEFMMSFFSF